MNLSQLNRVLFQTLFLPVAALVLLAGVLSWEILNAEKTVARIQVVDQNIATANLITALIADQETGVQGYENTRREVYLQPFEFAVEPLRSSFAKLREGLQAQHADLRPVDALRADHQLWIDTVALPTINAIHAGHSPADRGIDSHSRSTMDKIRSIEAGIIADQTSQRTSLNDDWRQQLLHTLEVVVSFTIATGLIIGIFARNRLQRVSSAFQDSVDAVVSNSRATYQSEERLRATLISIAESVVVCDIDGRIEMLNTVAQRLSGWTQEDALDRPLDDVFPLTDELTHQPVGGARFTRKAMPSVALAPVAAAPALDGETAEISTAEISTAESGPPAMLATRYAVLLRKDGAEFYIERYDAPIYDTHGYLIGSVIVLSNLTEKRRTQNALLFSEKLAVAGRLAATIAHEIHNPLDSVVNLLYMIKQGATAEERDEFLDMAQSELSRVTQISRAMLGMHRESRTPVPLDVSELMQSVLVLLQRSITRAGITLNTNLAEGTLATGYPAELRQVFTNLLTNAAEASEPNTRIDVSIRNRPARRSAGTMPASPAGVLITIADQGSGIKPEVLADLFQPFFTTKGEKGSGLGLWISKGIVEKHGGTITVQSRTSGRRRGTTFNIFLPRGAGIISADSPAIPAETGAPGEALPAGTPALAEVSE
jgi:signal transduction histidine kinase